MFDELKAVQTQLHGAIFDDTREYRYVLWRRWAEGPMLAYIGLNPSTADEIVNDPTVTRCINFAKREGMSGMFMLNAFALRSTDPKALYTHKSPIGHMNDAYLKFVSSMSSMTIACWGVHGAWLGRGVHIASRLPGLKCFGTTKEGHPRHPLYLPSNCKIFPFN